MEIAFSDLNVFSLGVSYSPKHKRCRKWPGLAGVVVHMTYFHSTLLLHLSSHCILNWLTWQGRSYKMLYCYRKQLPSLTIGLPHPLFLIHLNHRHSVLKVYPITVINGMTLLCIYKKIVLLIKQAPVSWFYTRI